MHERPDLPVSANPKMCKLDLGNVEQESCAGLPLDAVKGCLEHLRKMGKQAGQMTQLVSAKEDAARLLVWTKIPRSGC